MKNLYLSIFILFPFLAAAQNEKKEVTDSAVYFSAEMGRLWREHVDSFYRTEAYINAQQGYLRHLKKSKNYVAFVLFGDVFHSDYSKFNEMIARDGFKPINEIGGRLGFGTSIKEGRAIFDLYYIVAGLNNKSKKDLEEIKTSFTSLMHLDIGYDLMNKNWLSIYPFGGLSMRISNIQYEKKATWDPNYTSIVNLLSDKKEVRLSSVRAGFQLGLGFDFSLFRNAEGTAKRIFFVKAGINRPLWKERYNFGDAPSYEPNLRQGNWIITFGFKFANKSSTGGAPEDRRAYH